MSAAYINCEVLPGLFETEYYVVVNGDSGYFVNRQDVRVREEPRANHRVMGQVLGYIIEQHLGKTLVQLPGEAVVGGLRTWVESAAGSAG